MEKIIPILLGAVIGYTTNWIAIKMLFRPHYEKYFLGIHIPFTPGLIPKEKGRIARNIGDSVGSYLLTPDVVMESLSHSKIDDYIRNWVESNIAKFKKEDKAISDFIINFKEEDRESFIKLVKERIASCILNQLAKEEFKQRIIELIESHILYNSNEKISRSISENIRLFLYEMIESDHMKIELKDLLENKIEDLKKEDRRFEEILSEDFILIIKESILDQNDEIVSMLKEMLKDPSMESKVKSIISSLVLDNMNKIITIFLNADIISDKVFKIIQENIDKPAISESIALTLETMTARVLEYKVGDLATDISLKIQEDEIIKIADSILNYLSKEENMDKMLNAIEENIKSSQPEIEEKALNLISNEIEIILNSEKLNQSIYIMVDQMVESVLDMPMSSIALNVDENTRESMVKFVKFIVNDFIQNKLAPIVELFNISRVVEQQINSFDVAFAEEIILQIADKELRAITWLGALLGGIMGMLSPLLQSI